ncbi:arylesterase [Roseivivax sp. CAU 1761]
MLRSWTYGASARGLKAACLVWLLAGGAAAEPQEVVALGDSLTQGYGLAQGDGLVPQLEAWLAGRGHEVTLVNAGVSGDTSAGGLARVEWSLSEETDALIVALGGNDLLRGIAPETTRANIDEILAKAGAREIPVLLVGIGAPGNYGREYQTAFDSMWGELAEARDTLLYPDIFAELRAEGDAASASRRFMQPDGIHPNAEGVARIVADLGPEVEKLLERVAERQAQPAPER